MANESGRESAKAPGGTEAAITKVTLLVAPGSEWGKKVSNLLVDARVVFDLRSVAQGSWPRGFEHEHLRLALNGVPVLVVEWSDGRHAVWVDVPNLVSHGELDQARQRLAALPKRPHGGTEAAPPAHAAMDSAVFAKDDTFTELTGPVKMGYAVAVFASGDIEKCREAAAPLVELARESGRLRIVIVRVGLGETDGTVDAYGIGRKNLPAVIAFFDGKPVKGWVTLAGPGAANEAAEKLSLMVMPSCC